MTARREGNSIKMREIPSRGDIEIAADEPLGLSPPMLRLRRGDLVAYSVVAAALIASMVVQTTTIQMDAAQDGLSLDWREPWILEGSSHAVWLILALSFPIILNIAPLALLTTGRVAATHLAAAIILSLLHVMGMFGLREALFPAIIGRAYHLELFSAQTLGYEFRKDAFTYCLFLVGFWSIRRAHDRVLVPAAAARQDRRVRLLCGKRAIFLDAAEVTFAKSAGNYVEVGTAAKTHLVRMTLAQLEASLAAAGAPHIRVHRSYIVNPDEVREIAPTGEGGVVIALNSGAEIPGSRRYRENVERAMALRPRPS